MTGVSDRTAAMGSADRELQVLCHPSSMEILYQDEHYLAVHKPAGLMVHRSALERGARQFLLQRVRDQIGRRVYPLHRLDRPTSGVVLFALSPAAAGLMSHNFEYQLIRKTYLAVVRGHTREQGMIDHPLRRRPDPDHCAAKTQAALTWYRRCAAVELPFAVGPYATARYSLLEVCPHTGRMHQIRRHLRHISHPIIGDTRYGDGKHNRFFRARHDCRRLLLAAVELTFKHPYTQQFTTIFARLDDDLERVILQLGWQTAVPLKWLRSY